MLPDHNAYTLIPELRTAPPVLTSRHVSTLLGCANRTVTLLITSGKLPAVRLGGPKTAYRVSRDALADFITRNATMPPGEAA